MYQKGRVWKHNVSQPQGFGRIVRAFEHESWGVYNVPPSRKSVPSSCNPPRTIRAGSTRHRPGRRGRGVIAVGVPARDEPAVEAAADPPPPRGLDDPEGPGRRSAPRPTATGPPGWPAPGRGGRLVWGGGDGGDAWAEGPSLPAGWTGMARATAAGEERPGEEIGKGGHGWGGPGGGGKPLNLHFPTALHTERHPGPG